MKVAYIQPIGGVSGDMLLASLMHLGLNISKLNDDLNKCYNKILEIIDSEKSGLAITQDLSQIKEKVRELTK